MEVGEIGRGALNETKCVWRSTVVSKGNLMEIAKRHFSVLVIKFLMICPHVTTFLE